MEDLSGGITSSDLCRAAAPGLIPRDKFLSKSLIEGISCFFYRAVYIVTRSLGCWHRHHSRPFTLYGRTYEVCFDCGKQLPYSLEHMSRVKETH